MSIGELLESASGLNQKHKYYGKYRGTVLMNEDPMQIGRIMAMVPDVSALMPTSWAMPCLPGAGIQYGVCVIPPLGAGVWIEFEQGDPDYPIWTGGFWGSAAEVPPLTRARLPVSPGIVMQTVAQNTIAITDVPPQILMKVGASTIMVRADGISIVAPNITINGALLVNNGALAVSL
ncbi:MAG: phage baseplate assembly protein V [Gemmatimonadaceae bacterium]